MNIVGAADRVRVRVYLNDAENSFDGFTPAAARLHLAGEFEVAAPGSQAAVFEVLDDVFTQLNVGGEIVAAADYTLAYRSAGHRSLSVGDVLVLGETAFAVARFGFDVIPATALRTATGATGSEAHDDAVA